MDLQHLRHFQAVAAHQGFTAAARVLGTSQSTLSEAVRRLEEDLGTTLFLRTRAGVRLTEAGVLLLERADALFGLVSRLTEEIRDVERGDRGRFVLGCHDRLGAYFLPRFLGDFLREHPRIEVELYSGSSADVRRAVLDRDVQFGLVVNTEPHPDLVIVDAFRDLVRVFSAAGRPATDEAEARRRLAGAILAVPARAPFESLLERMRAQGLVPGRVLACGDLGVAKSLALAGTTLALLPWRVATDGPGLETLHPALPWVEDRVHLVWRADLHRTRAAKCLREAVLTAARRLPQPFDHSQSTVSNAPTAVDCAALPSSIDCK